MDIPKFGELSERKTLDGDKVKIDDTLNKEIIVTGFHVSSSKYKSKRRLRNEETIIQRETQTGYDIIKYTKAS